MRYRVLARRRLDQEPSGFDECRHFFQQMRRTRDQFLRNSVADFELLTFFLRR